MWQITSFIYHDVNGDLLPSRVLTFGGQINDKTCQTNDGAQVGMAGLWIRLPSFAHRVVPDFIPGIGTMDDAALMAFVIKKVLEDECGDETKQTLRFNPTTLPEK